MSKKININDTIVITHPEALKDWDFQLNTRIFPETITINCDKKVAWLCYCGYRYQSEIKNHLEEGCPQCKNNK